MQRRFLGPFLLGAFTMLLLVVLVVWAMPGWLPRGGVVIRIGPAVPSPAPPAVAPPPPARVEAPHAPVAAPPVPPVPVPPAAPIDTIAATASADTADATATAAPGQLLVPVRGIKPWQLADTYTQARGQGRVHDAIDIRAARGTPVLAAADGTVLKLFTSERGGITLYELGPDGHTIYYYAHLDRYAPGMAEGKRLRQGDVIASVGHTGNAGAGNDHLHFEITTAADPRRWWAGTPQNPYPLLRRGISR